MVRNELAQTLTTWKNRRCGAWLRQKAEHLASTAIRLTLAY